MRQLDHFDFDTWGNELRQRILIGQLYAAIHPSIPEAASVEITTQEPGEDPEITWIELRDGNNNPIRLMPSHYNRTNANKIVEYDFATGRVVLEDGQSTDKELWEGLEAFLNDWLDRLIAELADDITDNGSGTTTYDFNDDCGLPPIFFAD